MLTINMINVSDFNYGNLSYTIQLWMIENVVSALNMTDKISLSTGFSIICNQIRGNKHVLIIVNKAKKKNCCIGVTWNFQIG